MAKHNLVNFIGVQFFIKLVPIAGVFLFSNLMPVEDFGILSLHLATIWIVSIVLSLNIHTGIGRFLFAPEIEDAPFLGTAFIALGASVIALGALWLLLSGPVAAVSLLPVTVVCMQIPIALALVAENVLTQIMIYRRRSGLLLGLVAIKAIGTILLALILTTTRETGKYYGVVIAELCVALVFVPLAFLVIRDLVQFRFVAPYLRSLLAYSLPLIVHSLSLAALSQSDRLVIGHLMDTASVGLYSLSYSIGALPLLIAVPIMNAFQPRFFEAMNGRDFEGMRRDADAVLSLNTAFVLGTLVVVPVLAPYVFSSAYHEAFRLIPVIALGALAQIGFLILTRILAYYNHTPLIAMIVAGAAALNIVLNILIIPRYGIAGAAFSTLAAQVFMVAGVITAQVALGLPTPGLSRLGAAGLVLVTLLAAGAFLGVSPWLLAAGAGAVMLTWDRRALRSLLFNRTGGAPT